VLREGSIVDLQRWETPARDLQVAVEVARGKVDAALKDDFDTPACSTALADLVKVTNLYLEGFQVQQQQP